MALNAHLALFGDYGTPDGLKPAAGSQEARAGAISGGSRIIPTGLTTADDKQWIELTGIRFQVRGDDRDYPVIELTKHRDSASPVIALDCCAKRSFASAKILILGWGAESVTGEANPVVEVIRLYTVSIESVRASFSGDGEMNESIMFKYEKIVWNYENVERGWNRAADPEGAQFSPPVHNPLIN